jgi:hypothetical protein
MWIEKQLSSPDNQGSAVFIYLVNHLEENLEGNDRPAVSITGLIQHVAFFAPLGTHSAAQVALVRDREGYNLRKFSFNGVIHINFPYYNTAGRER